MELCQVLQTIIPDGVQYMELYYSMSFHRSPHVAIVPSPDSYEKVRSHIISVREGIQMRESKLGQQYGGSWDVTFEVVKPRDSFDRKPDVIVNLVTHEEHDPCFNDYFGLAKISPNPKKPVQTVVCSSWDGKNVQILMLLLRQLTSLSTH